jgi:hypothetical protein
VAGVIQIAFDVVKWEQMMTLNEAKAYMGERYLLHPLYSRKKNPWHINAGGKANVAKTFTRVRARLNAEKQAPVRPGRQTNRKLVVATPGQLVVAKIQRASRMRKPTQAKRVSGEDMLVANA